MVSFEIPSAVVGLAALAALTFASAHAEAKAPEVQEQNGISFVTDGVGEEDKEALKSVEHSYNLRITSTDNTGHYHNQLIRGSHLFILSHASAWVVEST
jgi:hypothetical protein